MFIWSPTSLRCSLMKKRLLRDYASYCQVKKHPSQKKMLFQNVQLLCKYLRFMSEEEKMSSISIYVTPIFLKNDL